MTFAEILEQTIAMMQRQGRVSYRALRRQFDGLDEDYLEDLKSELIEVLQVAVDQDGRMLVWRGDARVSTTLPPVSNASEAEYRQLTVVFCDLVGSTDLSGRFDPEDLREVVQAFQETAAAVIQRYEGYIAQYLGDGLLIYFGYPIAYEDAAQRAAYTGLGIIASMETLNRRLQSEYGVQLAVRIGIHTGPVVVGKMGGGDRHENLALGETPNIAARLEGFAAPNTVVVSPTTASLIARDFDCEDLGVNDLKGMTESMSLARIVREANMAEREEKASVGAAILVGRDAECTLLLDRWEQSKSGQGQAVLISGEPGIGKSRLVSALRDHVIQENMTRITIRCSPYHRNMAFYPVVMHLEQLLQIYREDSPETKVAKLEQVLKTYRFPDNETLRLFVTLLGLPRPEEIGPSLLTPEQQRQRSQADLVAWLLEEAERQPLLCIWEDLHWIDPSSLEVLSLLINQMPTKPLMTLVTCRPEFQAPWDTQPHLTPVTLTSLSQNDVEAIATAVAGDKPLPATILRQIVDKTDGVPLFIEELTKTVLESGQLKETHGQYELTQPMETTSIPITLRDSLMARLDRLNTAKNVAQLGAVIGRQFSYELMKALLAYEEPQLQHELRLLVRAELIYQRGQFPSTTYMFKHALVQEVAYESLLRRRRQYLHGAVAQTIEALKGTQAADQADLLAYHYARSLHQDKTIIYALLAGDQAVRLHARAEASSYYEQALVTARTWGDTPDAQRAQIDAILKLAGVNASSADLERDQENLLQAKTMAEALDDQPRLAQVSYWLGRVHYARGESVVAADYAEQSLAIADALGDEVLAAPPINLLGRHYVAQGNVARGSEVLARNAEQMHRIGNTVEEATAAALAGLAYTWTGDFTQGFAYSDRGLDLAQKVKNPFAEAAAYFFRGVAYLQRGAWAEAIADFDNGREVAEAAGDAFRNYLVKAFEGEALIESGNLEQARALLDDAIAFAENIGTKFYLGVAKRNLAAALLAMGELDHALAVCQEAVTVADEAGELWNKSRACQLLVDTWCRLDRIDGQEVEQTILETIRVQQEFGAEPELARSYLIYARLLRHQGKMAQAKAYNDQAIDMFRRMGMDWDLARAEHELGR